MKGRIISLTRFQYAIFVLDRIFEHPVFRSSDLVSRLSVSPPTARRIFKTLRQDGILTAIVDGWGRRAAILPFSELLNITGAGFLESPASRFRS